MFFVFGNVCFLVVFMYSFINLVRPRHDQEVFDIIFMCHPNLISCFHLFPVVFHFKNHLLHPPGGLEAERDVDALQLIIEKKCQEAKTDRVEWVR